jgi:uncharacterized protein YbaR (Trm112 family)
MIDPELLKILCCPETHQPLRLAEPALVETVNQRIAAGGVKNRAGKEVSASCDGGLVREDGRRGARPVVNREPTPRAASRGPPHSGSSPAFIPPAVREKPDSRFSLCPSG